MSQKEGKRRHFFSRQSLNSPRKACIESFVTYVRNQEKAPAASTVKSYERVILSYFGWYENAANTSGKRKFDDEERKRLVSQVAWADDKDGNDADLKKLLEPIVVISTKLYDGFMADRTKSFGYATLNATKNTCDLRSAALGYFVNYLFDEEEALKRKYDENDKIKTFLENRDVWKHKDRRGAFATSSREWREYSRALKASRIAPKR